MAKEKKSLRQKIRLKRDKFSERQRTIWSKAIREKLFNLEAYKKASLIGFYVSFGSEVKTKELIEESLKNGKKVAVPYVKGKQLFFSQIFEFEKDLRRGKWGILEPKEKKYLVKKEEIDLLVVPGVVFDLSGYRIGYGGGYYDRLLKEVKKALKVGLAYDFQVVNKIPREKHDLPVEIVVTEKRIIHFS